MKPVSVLAGMGASTPVGSSTLLSSWSAPPQLKHLVEFCLMLVHVEVLGGKGGGTVYTA